MYNHNITYKLSEAKETTPLITLPSNSKPFVKTNYFNKLILYYPKNMDSYQIYFNKTKPEKPNDFIKKIKKVSLLDKIVTIAESFFADTKKYLFKRIKELVDLFDEEEEQISIGSLKSMLIFLFSINKFSKPVITLNENGTFQISWKKDNNNLTTLRFKDKETLDYVIFKPSKYDKNPIILNGSMNIFDFKNYLMQLGLYAKISTE